MADSLYDLLKQHIPKSSENLPQNQTRDGTKYLSRLLSLRLADLTTTEPQSLSQASHSNVVSIQALSSRSHRTTSASSDHLTTLGESLPVLSSSVLQIRDAVPQLDESAVKFASSYSKSKDDNAALNARKESMLLSRQADKLQDILELPGLLSTAIASAGTGAPGGANYSQALDLFAHIKRLQILYADSDLVKRILSEAEVAMKDMTTNLITALRGQNIRLAAAIRTIGWLRRVAPELYHLAPPNTSTTTGVSPPTQDEGDFGAVFLCARLCTFITMTEALAPLRDLADQETVRRLHPHPSSSTPEPIRRSSTISYTLQGQQTERYLKRYIEIFREQSFACLSMFRNIFPTPSSTTTSSTKRSPLEVALTLPSALATFPLHLVEMFMETLQTYLPNVADPAARESLLMQVLYAANSLGRLGADFSMMIALLDEPAVAPASDGDREENGDADESVEPEWARVVKKHRVQAARLEAMAAGQDDAAASRRGSADIVVR